MVLRAATTYSEGVHADKSQNQKNPKPIVLYEIDHLSAYYFEL